MATLSDYEQFIANRSTDAVSMVWDCSKNDSTEDETQSVAKIEFDPRQNKYHATFDKLKNKCKYTLELRIYSSKALIRNDFVPISVPFETFPYSYPIPAINNVNASSVTSDSAIVKSHKII